MALNLENNVKFELGAGMLSGTNLLTVKDGKEGLLPDLPFELTVVKFASTGVVAYREVMLATGLVDNVLTVTRAYEPVPDNDSAIAHTSVAHEFDEGDIAYVGVTAGIVKALDAAIQTKLGKSGETRTGMTAKRVMITDASGAETYLSGTLGQVVGFDVDGDPEAQTPTVDINGLAAVTQLSANDAFIIYEDGVAGNRKILNSDVDAEISKGFFGSGSDGSLSVTTGTTSLTAAGGYVIKNYENLTVSGGTLDVQGEFNVLYVRGTFTMNGGAISANGRGAAGGAQTNAVTGNAGTNGRNLFLSDVFLKGNGGTAAVGGGTAGVRGLQASFLASTVGGWIRVSSGAGAASGSAASASAVAPGGKGGNGGGVLIIIANRFNFTGGTISANGEAGAVGGTASDGGGAAGGGGGGGGGGGTLVLMAKTFVANSGTKTANGGNGGGGGAGSTSSSGGGPGGGGGGGFTVDGGNGGIQGANGVVGGTNGAGGAGGTGGTGGVNSRSGGGGGGGGGGLVYSQSITI